jgi:hypothetical protein
MAKVKRERESCLSSFFYMATAVAAAAAADRI